MDRTTVIRKTLYIIIYYGLFFNLVFFFLDRSIYANRSYHAIYLIMYFGLGIIDTIQRPIETEIEEHGNYRKILAIIFLLNPLLFVLARRESEVIGEIPLIQTLGLLSYFLAGIIVIISRHQLGVMATGTLLIREDHELMTNGLYKYSRNPMYAGSLIGVLSFCLIVPSIIVGLSTLVAYYLFFNDRANYEEQILSKQFGSEYDEYKQKTSKYIPYLY